MKICKIHGKLKKKDIYIKPNGVKYCYFCRKEYFKKYYAEKKDIIASKQRLWEKNNRVQINEEARKWVSKNRKKHNEKVSMHAKECCKHLTDAYVRKMLTARSKLLCKDIPEILILLKRVSILIKRYIINLGEKNESKRNKKH